MQDTRTWPKFHPGNPDTLCFASVLERNKTAYTMEYSDPAQNQAIPTTLLSQVHES